MDVAIPLSMYGAKVLHAKLLATEWASITRQKKGLRFSLSP